MEHSTTVEWEMFSGITMMDASGIRIIHMEVGATLKMPAETTVVHKMLQNKELQKQKVMTEEMEAKIGLYTLHQ